MNDLSGILHTFDMVDKKILTRRREGGGEELVAGSREDKTKELSKFRPGWGPEISSPCASQGRRRKGISRGA